MRKPYSSCVNSPAVPVVGLLALLVWAAAAAEPAGELLEAECLNVPPSTFTAALKSTLGGISDVLSVVSQFSGMFQDFRVANAIHDCADLLDLSSDELSLALSSAQTVNHVKEHLDKLFNIKNLGTLNYFLGIEVIKKGTSVVLSQKKFCMEIVQEAGVQNAKTHVTPLPLNFKLHEAQPGTYLSDPSTYRSIVGKLSYPTNTRPDISFAVQVLSQFLQHPGESHMSALKHLVSYVKGTSHYGIQLQQGSNIKLQAYSDSDWASCPITRRSVTGYVILFGKNPITWKSKKQPTVSKSSTEAEYRAISQAAAEVTWMVNLLPELGKDNLKPVILNCDNKSAIQIGKNPVLHERMKYIEIDVHFTREKVLDGLLQLTYLPTQNQLADVLTKILPSSHHKELLVKLGMFMHKPSPV